MITNRDRDLQAETGLIPPDRLRALTHALRAEATDAKHAARQRRETGDTHAAAALGGKKVAYKEAALMVEHIMNGYSLRPRRYSTARRLAREWSERRRLRAGGEGSGKA